MNMGLIFAFIFYAGSLLGWILEFGFRNLISHKGPRNAFFINPGFCRGPYLPIYGIGLCVMFTISFFLTPEKGYAPVWVIVIGIGVCMSAIEFIGGWILLKFMNMRLWDYSKEKGNIKGFICPKFSLIWMVLGGIYYIVIHPRVIDCIIWLSNNLAFSFIIGLFWGVFLIDLFISYRDAQIIKEFGKDNEVIIKYDELKALIQKKRVEKFKKSSFFNQMNYKGADLKESLHEFQNSFELKKKKHRKNKDK